MGVTKTKKLSPRAKMLLLLAALALSGLTWVSFSDPEIFKNLMIALAIILGVTLFIYTLLVLVFNEFNPKRWD